MPTILRLSSLAFPSSPAQLFGREGPLVAEIGAGSGAFIELIAKRHPTWNVLGIERAPQSVARSSRKLRLVDNARLIKGEAGFVVRNVVQPESLAKVFINFPDPWPRRRHHHRRLLVVPFLQLLASRLELGGKLLLTTDHPDYLEYVQENVRRSGLYEITSGDPPPEALETKYALKWKSRERDIHHLIFTRTGEPDEFGTDIEILDDMHHSVLEGELPDPGPMERRTFPFSGGVAIVLEAYRDMEASRLAFLVHVEENDLSEDVVIEARQGKNGIVIGLKRFGEPLNTRGVGEAVRLITEWFEQQGLSVIHRKY